MNGSNTIKAFQPTCTYIGLVPSQLLAYMAPIGSVSTVQLEGMTLDIKRVVLL